MEVVSLTVTVVLALTGYLITYLYSLQLSKRKEQLELIDKRIKDFYGPLYISIHVSRIAYETLLGKMGRKVIRDQDNPLTEKELAEWRVWSKSIFRPLNESLEKLILGNAYLIREEEMPECLLKFVTHVSAYKANLAKWDMGDFSEHFTALDFPVEIDAYATKAYRELKAEQLRLIGKLRPRIKSRNC